jgi:hypothetical protein
MYSYIKRMCNACPGCVLANPTKSKSSELVYNFPIKAPFLVLFIDAYSAGKLSSFDGSEVYLIACCGMTGFASMEPIQHANSKNLCIRYHKDPTALRFFVTQLFWTRTANFWGSAVKRLIFIKSTAMFSQATTITQ